ncbi:DNA-methyltransferase [Clostridioides difficile]
MIKTDRYELYNDECLEIMNRISDKTIDIVVTDPPYLIDYQSNRRKNEDRFNKIKNDKGNYILIQEYLEECHRIMNNNTAIYCFCSWHNIDLFKKEFERYFKLKNIIVWNKNNHGTGDLRGSYAPKHEFILFGHKGRTLLRGKRIADVINCPKVVSKKLTHPTEKPLELLEIFIKQSSDINSIVFDGFMGTGSCGLAAKKLNRKFIGIELDKDYYDIAKNRLELIL